MSALAEEKGGKSAKTPTLIWPAAVMSSTASALAMPALERSAIASSEARKAVFVIMSRVPSFLRLSRGYARHMSAGSPGLHCRRGSAFPRAAATGFDGDALPLPALDRGAEHHEAQNFEQD